MKLQVLTLNLALPALVVTQHVNRYHGRDFYEDGSEIQQEKNVLKRVAGLAERNYQTTTSSSMSLPLEANSISLTK